MKTLIYLFFVMFAQMAQANSQEAYVCESVDNNVVMRLWLILDNGELQADRMLISDPMTTETLLDVSANTQNLYTRGSAFVTYLSVDPLFENKKISSVPINSIKSISIALDLSYAVNQDGQDLYSAQVTYATRSGEILGQDFDCRHVPNQVDPMIFQVWP